METGKRFRVSFVMLSVGYIVLGLVRLFVSDPKSTLICYLLGCLSILGGIVRIVFYFIREEQTRVFKNDLAVGILLLIAGVFIIAQPAVVMALLPVFLGFAVVFDSVLKLQYSFELKRTGFRFWWFVLIVAVLMAVLGALLILGSFEGSFLLLYFSIVLLLDGCANLATLFLLTHQLKKKEKQRQEEEQQEL